MSVGKLYAPQRLVGSLSGTQQASGDVIPRGEDGISPVVQVTPIDEGYRIEITDIYGTKAIEVMNGKDGLDGVGEKGDKGDKGDRGESGVYCGKDTPPETATVWIDPSGEPTSTEEWEFDMEDGTTETRTVVVVS